MMGHVTARKALQVIISNTQRQLKSITRLPALSLDVDLWRIEIDFSLVKWEKT